MKRITRWTACFLICLNLLTAQVFGRELIAVGQVVGLHLQDGTVTVAAFDETIGQPAKHAGVQVGDRILRIDGKDIRTAEDVRGALNEARGSVMLELVRGGKTVRCSLTPEITPEGPKLGLYLRQGVTGVGTVTWYDPITHQFGSLGHGVNSTSGQLLRLTQGMAYDSRINTVRKGKPGDPGQLMGCLESKNPIGTLYSNLPQGVFGICSGGFSGEPVTVAKWDDVTVGNAVILSTVSGNSVREYSVEILKIYPNANETGRNLLLRVTDPALLEITGGIVQGMSGSPIIQDGKLVGAVTHVLVNSPDTGYGIFIENMLEAAG